jgi:hypothetical protein
MFFFNMPTSLQLVKILDKIFFVSLISIFKDIKESIKNFINILKNNLNSPRLFKPITIKEKNN